MGGGNLFINPIDFEDTTFTWFPLDSLVTLNPNGRLFPGTVIESPVDSNLNLSISHLISVKVKGFGQTYRSLKMCRLFTKCQCLREIKLG